MHSGTPCSRGIRSEIHHGFEHEEDILKTERSVGGTGPPRPAPNRPGLAGWWSLFIAPHVGDIAGLIFVLVTALAYLSPALKDGLSFAPAELGRQLSILTVPNHPLPQIHNVVNGDIITQGVAWNTLDWNLVHHGQFPLWNAQSGNGLPQFLNFESAPLALPTLIGYLFPLRVSYLITILVKLLIAGTGAYVVVRLLGGRALPSTLAGITAMLSGPFAGWLGWSISGPLAWTGWIVAAAILLYRAPPGHRGWRYVLLAASSAFCIFGGFPEDYLLMAGALSLLFVATGITFKFVHHEVDWRGVGRLALGAGAGLAIASPLWLPGIAILRNSVRNTELPGGGIPLHSLSLLIAQGYDGLPIATAQFPHGTYFGALDYFETAAYVGVIALVLAGTCVVLAWRRPVVIGLVACVLGSALVTYDLGSHAPVQHLIADLGLGTVALQRVLTELCFAVAILAGLGLELVLRHWHESKVQRTLLAVIAILAVIIGVLWLHSSLPSVPLDGLGKLTSAQATALRRRSLYWPTFEIVLLAGVALTLVLFAHQPRRARQRNDYRVRSIFGGVMGLQAIFLIIAGVGINSYAHSAFPRTQAVTDIQHTVGTQLFGTDGPTVPCTSHSTQLCGLRTWNGVGIYPEMNLGYGLTELATHDPITPRAYFSDFPVPNTDRNATGLNLFAPNINSVGLARLYGVKYVLVQSPAPVPSGMRVVRSISVGGATINIAKVPNSHRFSFNGALGSTTSSANQRPDRVLTAHHPNDAQYVLKLRTPRPGRLAIRITDVPGWHATANGHPLALRRGAGDLMRTLVPQGTTMIVLTYRPTLLTVGEVFALISLGTLLFYGLFELSRRSTAIRMPPA